MIDTTVRFTHTDSIDGHPPQATHTVHLPIRPADLDTAVARVEHLASLFTTVTGAYAGGDSWHEWCEPAQPRHTVALHIDIRLAEGTRYAERFALARALALTVTGRSTHRITTAHDWSVQ